MSSSLSRRSVLAALSLAHLPAAALAQPFRTNIGPDIQWPNGTVSPTSFPMYAGGVIASLDFDFQNGRYYQAGQSSNSPTVLTTTSRASTGYADSLDGTWTSFSNNVPRITNKGLLVEEARTSVVLQCRDLTNAVWTKSNITAALDQTGIDGTSNSATRLTATAGNGTALQAITLASSARFQSAFVKRLTGTGTINMTMDNGSTWTVIVPTSSWTRLTIPTQTLANPTVGFRIVTSGDAIAVDFVQNENGTFATSPILVTTVAATRAADLVTATTTPVFGSAATLAAMFMPTAPIAASIANQAIIRADNGTANELYNLFRAGTTGAASFTSATGGVGNTVATTVWGQNTSAKAAGSFGSAPMIAFNGAGLVTGSNSSAPSSISVLRFGANSAGGALANGYIMRGIVWPTTRVANASLIRITQ